MNENEIQEISKEQEEQIIKIYREMRIKKFKAPEFQIKISRWPSYERCYHVYVENTVHECGLKQACNIFQIPITVYKNQLIKSETEWENLRITREQSFKNIAEFMLRCASVCGIKEIDEDETIDPFVQILEDNWIEYDENDIITFVATDDDILLKKNEIVKALTVGD